jgi:hypothetical protein
MRGRCPRAEQINLIGKEIVGVGGVARVAAVSALGVNVPALDPGARRLSSFRVVSSTRGIGKPSLFTLRVRATFCHMVALPLSATLGGRHDHHRRCCCYICLVLDADAIMLVSLFGGSVARALA